MKLVYKYLLILLPLTLITACEKEILQGPEGPRGNANVKSDFYTVTDWDYEDPSFFVNITVPDLTYEIIQNGAVLVYLKTENEAYLQLPLTYYPSTGYSSSLNVVTMPQKVQIIWTDSDLIQPIEPPVLNFKIITVTASEMIAHPDLNFSAYHDMARVFELN